MPAAPQTTDLRAQRRSWSLLPVLAVAVVLGAVLGLPGAPAGAATPAGLSIKPITWNIIGLDSNKVTVGPDTFPVGARICNTGGATATGVGSTFVWDSANPFVNIEPGGASALTFADLAPNACVDAYYDVEVTRDAAAYDTSRRYHITASATGVATVSTPTPRELYVEHLVSQARNAVNSISGSAIAVAPTKTSPGQANLVVGRTYTFVVDSSTATGGYEQLESFLNFPNTIFQVLSVRATYSQPSGATNDTMYADACGWDNVIGPRKPTGTYLACKGPIQYGGNAGGSSIVTTYTVKVVSAGTGRLGTLIYDFSGSSFHYNGDYDTNLTSIDFVAAAAPDLALTKTHNGSFTVGTPGTYTLAVRNVGGLPVTGTTTVTDTLPSGLTYVSGTGTGWSCGNAGQVVTCTTSTAVAAGASAPDLTLTVTPTAGGAVSNAATVANALDGNAANDTDDDTATVDRLPLATADGATTDLGVPVAIDVLTNDTLGDSPTTVTTAAPTTTANKGTVACTTTACTFTPKAGAWGTDTFSYTITDADGDTSTATVTVTIRTPAPDLAIAKKHVGAFVRNATASYTLDVSNVGLTPATGTTTVTDVLPAGMTFVSASGSGWTCGAAGATVTCTTPDAIAASASAPTITLTVTPTVGGTVSNTATVANGTDGNPGNDASTDTTNVDRLPTAADDSTTTPEDTPVTVAVLGNDDAGDGPAVVTAPTTPANGSVVCTPSDCTYAPAADFHGTDAFDYTITDSDGDSSTATVRVTVTAVNDPPVATDDADDAVAGTPVTVAVRTNDTDPDGDTLTVTTPAPTAAHGTVTCAPTTCTYTADRDFSGTDTFDYTISDGNGGTDTATVTITVRPRPVDLALAKVHRGTFTAGADATYDLTVSNVGGTATSGPTTVTDVLPSGLAFVSAGGTGWTCAAAGSTVTCTTATAIAAGADAPVIALVVRPAGGGTVRNTATVANADDADATNDAGSDDVLVDVLPVAVDDSATTLEDEPVTTAVLTNDSPGDAPAVVTSSTPGTKGSVSCTSTACTYRPATGAVGTDSFTYTITDADGDTSTATVTVTITPVERPAPPVVAPAVTTPPPAPAPPSAPTPIAAPIATAAVTEAAVTAPPPAPAAASASSTETVAAPVDVAARSDAPVAAAELPRTGASVTVLALVAAGLLGLGGVLVVSARRRRT